MEKLKDWALRVLSFLFVPLVAIMYAMGQRQRRLQEQLATEKAKAQIGEALAAQEEAKRVADQKEQGFEQLASDYERTHGSGGGSSEGGGGVSAPH